MKKRNKNSLAAAAVLAAVLLLAASSFCLSGCADAAQSGPDADRNGEKLHIVTTIFPPYDFVKKIGGEDVEVIMLLKPGMESHSYEPTPADIFRIMDSDLFLYAGGESDVWVEELLEGADTETKAAALLDWVDPLEEETSESMQVRGQEADGAHGTASGQNGVDGISGLDGAPGGDDAFGPNDASGPHGAPGGPVRLADGEYDEHVWTSPRNAMAIVERLCETMSELDPGRAELFSRNAEAYLEQLRALDAAFAEVTEGAENKTLIFGDRFPLLYFVKTYGLEYDAAFPGCSMETEPSAATVASLTDRVRREHIPVVFYMEMSNGKVAQAIAEAAGAKTAVFYAVHSVSAEDLAAGEDYVSLMYRNVESLREALR